ncbi:unnamed protein product [Caenorhabditis nigoni]
MLSNRPITLRNLRFNPLDSITFKLEPRRQKVPYEIQNDEDVDIIVKWKSTRARTFNTQPNYAIIRSKTKMTFQLVFKGMERGGSTPADRFSAVISAIKPTDQPAKQIWKQHELRSELLIGLKHKKFVFVIFEGVNEPEWWNKSVLGEDEPILPNFGIDKDDEEDAELLNNAMRTGAFQHVVLQLDPPGDPNQ